MRWMLCVIALTPGLAMGELVTFENFTSIPVDSAGRLIDANNNSSNYAGVTWDINSTVFGAQYATSGSPPYFGDVFGQYGLTNGNDSKDLVLSDQLWF